MLKDNNFPGVMQIISGSSTGDNRLRGRDYIVDSDDHHEHEAEGASSSKDVIPTTNSLTSYLILSPSSPVRTFAISFLSHWVYSTVMIVTICAFVISSAHSFYCNFDVHVNNSKGNSMEKFEKLDKIPRGFAVLEVTRWILFVVLLSEMVIKLIARGFLFTGKFAYLRILWDWLDVLSLVLIFISIIIPWKAMEFSAAAVLLVKLIPILPGSINAFIFLCSCAKKLIPVLVYGIIIIIIYGTVIFTLFVKYQEREQEAVFDDGPRESVSKSNESTSDSQNENNETFTKNLVDSHLLGVEGDLLSSTSTAHEKSQNFSFRLTMECLPTNFRSLSGSLIQAIKMLTLENHYPMEASRSNGSSSAQTSCQSETYILSIIETLVIISGTLPMISMTFSALLNFFQKCANSRNTQDSSMYHSEHHHHHQHSLLNRSDSGESGGSQQRHEKNCQETSSLSSCFSSSMKEVANILCDCDYYFCCLASLQRKLNPCASGLLNSNKFKVFVLLVVSTDFLSMILLIFFSESAHCAFIDFPNVTSTWLIISYVKICFGLYTVEVLFKWCALASDEYWMNVWSAFDLLVVLVHWVGYTIIHYGSYANHCLIYIRFCGILMIRMLKVVPYWESLEQSLKLTWFSIVGNRHNLFVILICSCSSILLKYAALMLEAKWTSSKLLSLDLIPSVPLNIYILVESIFQLVLYFLFAFVVTAIYFQVFEVLKTSHNDGSTSNPSISLLLNNHRDSQFSEMTIMSSSTHHLHPNSEPRRSFNDSSSPISVMHGVTNSIHHRNKYRLASSPCESNNGLLLTPDTRSIMSPRSSDILSPLLTVPTPNGLNGHAYNMSDRLSHLSEENIHSRIGDTTSANFTTNTNRTRNFFSSCSSIEDLFNLTSAAVIILSSINIALAAPENGRNQMTWRSLYLGRSLWLEVVLIMSITLHIIYKTRLPRFPRETFLQISTLVDLILILAAAAEVYGSGMKWVPIRNGTGRGITFLQCAKVLSASRVLLLISRISWLQCIGSALCYLFWKVIKYVGAFGYLWVVFIVSVTEMQKMMTMPSMGQHETHSKQIAFDTNSTNATEKQNTVNETSILSPLENEEYFLVHPVSIATSTFLLLLTFGTLLGFLHHRLQSFSKLFEKFITPNQVAYQRSKIWQSQPIQFSFPVPDSASKPTEGLCVPILYYVANHPTFDLIVMAIIFSDALGIAFEHFATSDRAMVLRKHYPAYMLFLYGMEITSKLVGNGVNFFKSHWNIFDCIIVSVCSIDFFVCLIHQSWIALLIQNLRFLRVLRIFQFAPFVNRTNVIQGYFFSIPKAMFILWNVTLFYLCLYLAVAIVKVRCSNEEGNEIMEASSFLQILTAPMTGVINISNIFDCVGNNCVASFTFSYLFYLITLAIFSLLRFSVVFCVCLVLTVVLTQYLQEKDYKASCSVSQSVSFLHDNEDDDMDRIHNQAADKSSFLIPCSTSDTSHSHDIETPTSSAGTSRQMNPPTASTTTRGVIDSNNKQNEDSSSGLYNTTTFTSTREINGCKVFFVEAMITTV